MSKKFIAYFDYLGFRDFMMNNTIEEQKFIIGNNLIEIGNAMSSGEVTEVPGGFIPDISKTNINCINFSDTIIFWSNDDELESLDNILQVSFSFNSITNLLIFPVRGALVHGEIFSLNESMHSLTVNSVFGKGLIYAHSQAESLNWAGSVISDSILTYLKLKNIDTKKYLSKFCKGYDVPYKNDKINKEYAFNLVSNSLNEKAYKNFKRDIINNFYDYCSGLEN
jgi:hypothetical protein